MISDYEEGWQDSRKWRAAREQDATLEQLDDDQLRQALRAGFPSEQQTADRAFTGRGEDEALRRFVAGLRIADPDRYQAIRTFFRDDVSRLRG